MAPPGTRPAGGAPVPARAFSVVFPYGFIDQDGMHHFWQSGQPVRDPSELALLRARGVNLKED